MPRLVEVAAAAFLLAAAAVPSSLRAQTSPVYPGDPSWVAQSLQDASAQITGARPRSGNASLQLRTSGNSLDWAYYVTTAGDPGTSSFGLLRQVSQLAFDWLRDPLGVAGGDAPWLAQTPVLRLYVREDDPTGGAPRYSQLVWERWYNDPSPAPLDQWQSEDLLSQRFWRVTLEGPTGAERSYTRAGCVGGPIDPLFPLLTLSPIAWTGSGGCYDPSNAFVWALGVGVGSNWPHEFLGFADNVQLSFTDGAHVGANFELPPPASVPEPSPVALVLVGLAALGAGRLVAVARRPRATSVT